MSSSKDGVKMIVEIDKKDRVIVRNNIYCFLIKNKQMKQISWKSYLRLAGYGMLDLESNFWGMTAKNYIINNHYMLEVEFV
jgi:hypothetical protein